MHVSHEDRTDVGGAILFSSERASLGYWLGEVLGEVEGVLAVWYARQGLKHRVWTVPARALAVDGELAAEIEARVALVRRKFPEQPIEFGVSEAAGAPAEGAVIVYARG